jgi:hypothetical protein
MKQAYQDFSTILDNHTEDLAQRKHNYIKQLGAEYCEKFPDSRELKTNTIYYFVKCYRLTHDEIERKHGPSYAYNLRWRAKKENRINSEK